MQGITAIERLVSMIEAIENMGMSLVWLAGDYLYGFEPHVSADTIRRFIAHFGTHGLLLHSIAQIVQLGIMTKGRLHLDVIVSPPS